MAKEPDDMVMPMLREMRADINRRFDKVDDRFEEVNNRLDKLEAGQKSIRHALTADTMMSKYMIGDFEERISDLERKVEDLIKAK
jgi:hypothetical protein